MIVVDVLRGLFNFVMVMSVVGIAAGLLGALWKLARGGPRIPPQEERLPKTMARQRPNNGRS